MVRFLLVIAVMLLPALAVAQERFVDLLDQAEDKNSFIISFLEDQLSDEDRKIRLSGVSGLLSSSASVAQITISDHEGVWLLIRNANVAWNRGALFDGAVEVERLSAELIEYRRHPVARASALPSAQASSFQVPDLPVSVQLKELQVDRFRIGETLLGTGATLALTGGFSIGGGALEMSLALQRLDGPGGSFSLAASFDNDTEELALDLSLLEPAGGLVANLASISGLPELDLSIAGGGPLSDLELGLSFRADELEFLSGALRVAGPQTDRRFSVALEGQISPLVSPSYRPFFEGRSTLDASGRRIPGGGIALGNLDLRTASTYLTGWLVTSPDGFLSDMLLTGAMGRADGAPMILPVPGGRTRLSQADIEFRFEGNQGWGGSVKIADLDVNDVSFGAGQITIDGAGSNIDVPGKRALSGRVTGDLTEITTARQDVAEAFGRAITFLSEFSWSDGAPLVISQARVSGKGLAMRLSGAIADFGFEGDFAATVDDLAPFSALTERQMAGGIRFASSGSLSPLSGAFDLQLQGTTNDLALGIRDVDPLLAGETRLTGRLARTFEGTEAERLRLFNPQMSLSLDGTANPTDLNLDMRALVHDLSAISDQHEGKLSLIVTASGSPQAAQMRADFAMPGGRMDGHVIDNLTLSLTGQIARASQFVGEVLGVGSVDGNPLVLTGKLTSDDRLRALREFSFSLGSTLMRGTLGQGGDGLFSGNLVVRSQDIEPAAALLFAKAGGAVDLSAEFSRAGGQQRLRLTGGLNGFELAGARADQAELSMEILDLFGIPLFDGSAQGTGLAFAGRRIARFAATSKRADRSMEVTARSRLGNGTDIDVAGNLTNLDPGARLDVSHLTLKRGDISARLLREATIGKLGETITFNGLELGVSEGTFNASGQLGPENDLRVTARELPLNVASLIAELPGIGGTISGQGHVVGSVEQPKLTFDVTADAASMSLTNAIGLPPMDLRAQGELDAFELAIEATATAGEALAADVTGTLPIGPGEIDLSAEIGAFPLSALNALSGDRGLAGRLSGGLQVSGRYHDPSASFDLQADGVSARVLRDIGIGPLRVAATGSLLDGQVEIASARAEGQGGLSATGAGRIPLRGDGLDVSAGGIIPMRLANIALADSGIQMAGTARVSARATGSADAPQFGGSVQMLDGVMVDPRRNIRIEALRINADLVGDSMVLRDASGQFVGGGTVTATGQIGITENTPSNLTVRLIDAHYTDGIAVDTTISGRVEVTGPLARSGRVVARLTLGPTEIAVSERFAIREGVLLDVTHRNPPGNVRLTLDRAGVGRKERSNGSRGNYHLDLVVDAPNRIFIRGRGLDVEMGGSLAVRGPARDPQPVGRFELRRGRISVLGQRITFNEGWIALTGDFDPEMRLEAQTSISGTVITLVVSGPVSNPNITLSSAPELPQDEILALLIFQRDLSSLTPFQIAQLASAAATLAGSGDGLLDQFRSRIGLDDFEIITSEEGGLGVRAGAYLNENLYLDVEAAGGDDSRAALNLDLTDDIRAKVSFGLDGESSLGLFYERDY